MRGAILPDTESASTLDLNILALELRNIYRYIYSTWKYFVISTGWTSDFGRQTGGEVAESTGERQDGKVENFQATEHCGVSCCC